MCVCVWLVFLGVCACVSAQGLGGLYKCDHPATHDCKYIETLMTPLPNNTDTPTCQLHHPSFKYCAHLPCFRACDCKFALSHINFCDTALGLSCSRGKRVRAMWRLAVAFPKVLSASELISSSRLDTCAQLIGCVCYRLAEPQVIHHVGREESSSEE